MRQRKPIHEQATQPVKAVKRRPSPGLLPPELLDAGVVHFTERVSDVMTANDYELATDEGAVVMDAVSRLGVFRGWRYDFLVGDALRFSIRRDKRLVVFEGLRVLDAKGGLLAEFRQQPTAFSVHFDVVDAEGQLRLKVHQPESEHRRFGVFGPGERVAIIGRDSFGEDTRGRWLEKGTAVDAFDVRFEAPLGGLDRALCLAAAVFVDRLYTSDGDSTADRLLGDRRKPGSW